MEEDNRKNKKQRRSVSRLGQRRSPKTNGGIRKVQAELLHTIRFKRQLIQIELSTDTQILDSVCPQCGRRLHAHKLGSIRLIKRINAPPWQKPRMRKEKREKLIQDINEALAEQTPFCLNCAAEKI